MNWCPKRDRFLHPTLISTNSDLGFAELHVACQEFDLKFTIQNVMVFFAAWFLGVSIGAYLVAIGTEKGNHDDSVDILTSVKQDAEQDLQGIDTIEAAGRVDRKNRIDSAIIGTCIQIPIYMALVALGRQARLLNGK